MKILASSIENSQKLFLHTGYISASYDAIDAGSVMIKNLLIAAPLIIFIFIFIAFKNKLKKHPILRAAYIGFLIVLLAAFVLFHLDNARLIDL